MFHSQPQNFSVEIGEIVTFDCTFSGSPGIPTWIINGREYAYSATLPPNHHIDLTGSFVTLNVIETSMNGNYYQCVIDSCYSRIGYLQVLLSRSQTKHGQLCDS